MSRRLLSVFIFAAFYFLQPALAQFYRDRQAQVPDQSVKMINSASIPLNVSFYSRGGGADYKRIITIKARKAEIIRGNPYLAEICTKGHGCSSTSLKSRGIYEIVRSEKEKRWIIVELISA